MELGTRIFISKHGQRQTSTHSKMAKYWAYKKTKYDNYIVFGDSDAYVCVMYTPFLLEDEIQIIPQ